MPLVKIFIRKGKPAEYRKALLEGVHRALADSIKIPDSDRSQMLFELSEGDFETPPDKSENAAIIEIVMFMGRSAGAKKKLYVEIVANLAKEPGIKKDDILVILHEQPMENWCIRGVPGDEAKIGFRIDV